MKSGSLAAADLQILVESCGTYKEATDLIRADGGIDVVPPRAQNNQNALIEFEVIPKLQNAAATFRGQSLDPGHRHGDLRWCGLTGLIHRTTLDFPELKGPEDRWRLEYRGPIHRWIRLRKGSSLPLRRGALRPVRRPKAHGWLRPRLSWLSSRTGCLRHLKAPLAPCFDKHGPWIGFVSAGTEYELRRIWAASAPDLLQWLMP